MKGKGRTTKLTVNPEIEGGEKGSPPLSYKKKKNSIRNQRRVVRGGEQNVASYRSVYCEGEEQRASSVRREDSAKSGTKTFTRTNRGFTPPSSVRGNRPFLTGRQRDERTHRGGENKKKKRYGLPSCNQSEPKKQANPKMMDRPGWLC